MARPVYGLPSAGDIAAGKSARWGPDPSAIPADEYAAPDVPITALDAIRAVGFQDHQLADYSRFLRGDLPPVPDSVDRQHRAEAEHELRDLWKSDYETEIRAATDLVSTLPAQTAAYLAAARDNEGRLLGNTAAHMATLAGAARARGAQLPVGDPEAELRAIEARLGTSAYRKDEAMQMRYRELLVATGRAR